MSYWEATRKQLRSTGLLVGSAFLVLGLLQLLLHGKIPFVPLFGIGGALVLLGLIAPSLLRPFHWTWMKLSHALGWVMTRLILGILFFVILTSFGLVLRLFGRDILTRDWRRREKSYWLPREETIPPPERYERQF